MTKQTETRIAPTPPTTKTETRVEWVVLLEKYGFKCLTEESAREYLEKEKGSKLIRRTIKTEIVEEEIT